MKCSQCGRELREDSQFCDQCGRKVERNPEEKIESKFNVSALMLGILFSILVTLLITAVARAMGIPLIFGGLFLPFFWWQISKSAKK